MIAIARIESSARLRESLVLTGAFALLAVFLFAAFPGIAAEAELLEESLPEVLIGLFGVEAMETIEGFVGGYVYPMIWVLFAGIYFAYSGGGMIAGDIRARRMDLTLSNPVSRESVLLQTFAALWVPLLVLNAGVFVVVSAGAVLVGETIDPAALAMAHLLGVPYLLVCGAIGLVLSVVAARDETAEVGALGVVFVCWLVDGLAETSPDFEWVGALTPSRYYDPGAILVHEEYALLDAGVLTLAWLALLAVAVWVFTRRDI